MAADLAQRRLGAGRRWLVGRWCGAQKILVVTGAYAVWLLSTRCPGHGFEGPQRGAEVAVWCLLEAGRMLLGFFGGWGVFSTEGLMRHVGYLSECGRSNCYFSLYF